MFSEENQQEKLAKAMNLAGLAMMQLGAQIMQFNQKETTVNILLSLKPDADIKQIASVILTMKSMLIAVGASIVKLYHPLEGQSNPKCFRVLELNQYSIDIEKSLVQNQSDNIDSQHYPKLLTVDARPKKIQDQPSQINSETKEYKKLLLIAFPVIIASLVIFSRIFSIYQHHFKVISESTQLVESMNQELPTNAEDAQLQINDLDVTRSNLGELKDNLPFNGYDKAQDLVSSIDELIAARQNVLAPEIYKQALEKASQASQLTKNSQNPINLEIWQNALQIWNESISLLSSINEDSDIYGSVNKKLQQYSKNRDFVSEIVDKERQKIADNKPIPTPTPAKAITRSTGISMTSYQRISSGMSYEEVRGIIGESGEELSRVDIEGAPLTIMYMWASADGSNMNVMFQGNKVVQKAQFGLK